MVVGSKAVGSGWRNVFLYKLEALILCTCGPSVPVYICQDVSSSVETFSDGCLRGLA